MIASNVGGMAELVRDGIDGLQFKIGDSEDLREKIRMLVNNPLLLNKLRKNLGKVKTIAENAAEIEAFYQVLAAGKELSGADS